MQTIEQQIEGVVETILQDYGCGRDIDKMEILRQPDKDTVIDIIEKLRRIVFPGYFRDKTYRIYNARHNLSMLIEDVTFYGYLPHSLSLEQIFKVLNQSEGIRVRKIDDGYLLYQ